MKISFRITQAVLLLSTLLSCFAQAEQSETFGDYTVHYMAVNSTFISPEIARQYDILRGNRSAFLNISVLKNEADGSTTPVEAFVSGEKKNLLQQNQHIDFIKITEGDAIYYIGQFEFSNAENVKFELDIQPESKGREYSLNWSTTMYNN